jgi:hypothetical protein
MLEIEREAAHDKSLICPNLRAFDAGGHPSSVFLIPRCAAIGEVCGGLKSR